MPDTSAVLAAIFDEHVAVARATGAHLLSDVERLADQLIASFSAGGRLLVFGNGGSAADAQHFAGELTGHYGRDRRPLPAIALTTDSSVLTATANDYAYDDVFGRQVEAHAAAGDVVIGISTSGRAANVIAGIEVARRAGTRTWALTGADGGHLARVAEHAIRVPSEHTARVQEMHITIIHAVSELVDAWAAGESE